MKMWHRRGFNTTKLDPVKMGQISTLPVPQPRLGVTYAGRAVRRLAMLNPLYQPDEEYVLVEEEEEEVLQSPRSQ